VKRTVSFQKLAPGARAPEPASPNPPNIGELRQWLAEAKRQREALDKERNGLALKSLSGDTKAATPIETIDGERSRLDARIETLDAAIGSLLPKQAVTPVGAEQPDIEKPKVRTLDDIGAPRLRKLLMLVVTERRESIVFNIRRHVFRDEHPAAVAAHLSNADPLTVARELIEPRVPRVIAYREVHADNIEATDRQQRANDQVRNSEIDRLARELVESTELPPMPPEMQNLMAEA
jgi:hypothetical protein